MTVKRIYELATEQALERWAEARRMLTERPDSRIWTAREQERWLEYDELSKKLAAMEE